VFVADSQRSQLAANIDSLRNLRTNLLEYGMCLDDLPWVITYNKRDMPDAMSIEELERELNPYGVPSFPSIAVSGEGVFETFEKIGDMLMERLESQLRGEPQRPAQARPQAPAATTAAPPATYGIDPQAVREVREAIQTVAPAPAAHAPGREEFVIDRGFDSMTPGFPGRPTLATTSGVRSPSGQMLRPADLSGQMLRPVEIPAAGAAAAAHSVGTIAAREPAPLVLQRQIVVPVSASELAGGRKIRLVLDITIDPTA
jgi:hypothetical protein